MNTTVENPFGSSGDFANSFRPRMPRSPVPQRPRVTPPTSTAGSQPWISRPTPKTTPFSGKAQAIWSSTTQGPNYYSQPSGQTWNFNSGSQLPVSGAYTGVGQSPYPDLFPNGPSLRVRVRNALVAEKNGGISPLDMGKMKAGLIPTVAGNPPHQDPATNALLEGAGFTFDETTRAWTGPDPSTLSNVIPR